MVNIQLETEAQKVESDYDDDQFEEDGAEGEDSQISGQKQQKTEIIAEQVDIDDRNEQFDTLDQEKEGPLDETSNLVKEEYKGDQDSN